MCFLCYLAAIGLPELQEGAFVYWFANRPALTAFWEAVIAIELDNPEPYEGFEQRRHQQGCTLYEWTH